MDSNGFSKYALGKRSLPIEAVKPIAKLLDCSFDFIMQESDYGLFAYYLDKRVILSIEQYNELKNKELISIIDYKRVISNNSILESLKPLVYGL